MGGRKLITRDMMQAALVFRWSASQAAKHYGFSRNSVAAACERFNIVLPLMTFGKPITAPVLVWVDKIDSETPTPKAKLSASKAAIERALAKRAAEKRLQATS